MTSLGVNDCEWTFVDGTVADKDRDAEMLSAIPGWWPSDEVTLIEGNRPRVDNVVAIESKSENDDCARTSARQWITEFTHKKIRYYDRVIKKYNNVLQGLQPECDNCEDKAPSGSYQPASVGSLCDLAAHSSSEKVMLRLRDDSQPSTSSIIKSMEEDEKRSTNEEFTQSNDYGFLTHEVNKTPVIPTKEKTTEKSMYVETPEEIMQNIINISKESQSFDQIIEENPNKFVNTSNSTPQKWIKIGSGITMIPEDKYKMIKWESYTVATRSLLRAAFSRRTLATHSLSGKKSPAFKHKPAKKRLNPTVVSDVIDEVMDKFRVPHNRVRAIITSTCAAECKLLKIRESMNSTPNNENMPPPAEAEEEA